MKHKEILKMMECVGEISFKVDTENLDFTFSGDHAKDTRPAVYAWVCDDEIVYIGKAGRGLKVRMRQQANGFRGSGRGRAHFDFLAPLISTGKSIKLWAMWPGTVKFKDHDVPMHSAIEDWLIAVADPKPVRNQAG